MHKSQRRYNNKPPKRNDYDGRSKTPPKVRIPELTVLSSSKTRESRPRKKTSMRNRCCFVSPDQEDFGLLADASAGSNLVQRIPQEFSNIVPDQLAAEELRILKKDIDSENNRVETGSQYSKQRTCVPAYVETSDGSHWHSIEDTDDIDRYFLQGIDEGTVTFPEKDSDSIHIPEVPRVKTIAEKFTKFKKNNIQIRKLEEKVVCVEYDVFDSPNEERPAQVMRVFFSIKPVEKDEPTLKALPSKVKNKFNISSDDLSKLSQKEVEIIDDKLTHNQPYLEDLKKILLRKRNLSAKKNRLDLQSLYEIARKDCLHFDRTGTNALSTDELCEIKDLILKKCRSSVHGINRRTVSNKHSASEKRGVSAISESILAELLKERNSFIR